MSFSFNIGFGGYSTGTSWGGYFPPPPPPPPTEIRFEHDGIQHRLLVADDVLQNLLRLSAEYEAQQRNRRRYTPASSDAEQTIRVLSHTDGDVPLKTAVQRAKRRHHPDTGGTNEGFLQVIDAERVLQESGLL